MQARELQVPGAWLFTPPIFADSRGAFTAPFQADAFREAVGHPFKLAQANTSFSRRGVLRGIHYADVPPGQAKYVQCVSGSLLDVIVDIRVGSKTFGQWDAVVLDPKTMSATYLSEGLGHAFLALEDDTVASYLCSTPYNPGAEHGVSPLDPALGLPWGQYVASSDLVLSEKDRAAPTLTEASEVGALPTIDACRARISDLRA
ncbi:dTDP-4-dehydrorhamnose 3,5-epimerase family protein [Actinomycetospora rhizophila]|uniref:dTDP-4-dehydrorhamnose 3,5-epimerase family protein n=1 Tax=Actinomycetospora rhizophila TaxID=1416876 RepID=A0ABV9ZRB8_9PSEU